jgi:hypothetical protein
MAVIYLKHPEHGAKVATLEAEAIYDETHGWLRYDPDTPEADEDGSAVNEMADLQRRGRPRTRQKD